MKLGETQGDLHYPSCLGFNGFNCDNTAFSEGIWDCSEALSMDPKNVKALFRRAGAYFEVCEYNKAASDLERVLTYEPGHPQATLLKTKALQQQQQQEDETQLRERSQAESNENQLPTPSAVPFTQTSSDTENVTDMSQLSMLLQPCTAPLVAPTQKAQNSTITEVRPSSKKPPASKISIEEIVRAETEKHGSENFTVTKEIAEKYRNARKREEKGPAGNANPEQKILPVGHNHSRQPHSFA
jgi:tetratricopeptide (TPR) repeat protein